MTLPVQLLLSNSEPARSDWSPSEPLMENAGRRSAADADLRRLRRGESLGEPDIGAPTQEFGGHADRHLFRSLGNPLGITQTMAEILGRRAEQETQPVHRLSKVRPEPGHEGARLLQRGAGLGGVQLRGGPRAEPGFGQAEVALLDPHVFLGDRDAHLERADAHVGNGDLGHERDHRVVVACQ
jgi:hypothetical protein